MKIEHPTNRPNFTKVSIGSITVWYSYKTPIAYVTPKEFVITENVWGATTSRHLNYIDDDKSIRIPHKEFMKKFEKIGRKFK